MRAITLLLLCAIIMVTANAQPKMKILLVGTAHEFQEEYNSRQNFDSLVRSLARFDPDLICIESIPVWDTLSLRQVRGRQLAQAGKLKTLTPYKNADSVIRVSSDRLSWCPQDLQSRENLGSALFINHDFWNSYYHWFISFNMRLKANKKNLTALDGTFKDTLMQRTYMRQRTTEFGNIIFPLADTLGLLHLENIDDRADDKLFQALSKHAAKRLVLNLRIFKALRLYRDLKRRTENAEKNGTLISEINEREFQASLIKVIDEFPERWVKSRKAQLLQDTWNTRNARMAKRIADAAQANGSKRAIVFFGAAHIEFIRRSLAQNPGIEVILYTDLIN